MELLAPASNISTALTAFECGADSIYAGLQKFNARERGDNFDYDSFGELVSYARKKGKKVYLTLNTLLKEQELSEIVDVLHIVADIRPHAIIVQDLGLLRLINRCFPCLPIHASTQMAIHNSAGVKFLAGLGVERVILERQLTMSELKQTIANSPIEVEAFGHGALCCSLSGVCLFSSWMGGWSGNRGRCKQPCRRRFFAKGGNGFFFSTRDLYTLDLLTDFEKAGVAAIKIEGRLRKEDYVESVVTAYRRMLDLSPRDRRGKLNEIKKTLAQSLGRKWSHGFYDAKRPNDVVQHESLGVAGLLCGQVTRSKNNGFEVKLSRPFKVGDRIRIQPQSGDEGPSITVTKMSLGRKPISSAQAKERPFIFCDKPVGNGDRVFLIGRAAKVRELPADFDELTVIDLSLELSASGTIGTVAGVGDKWRDDSEIPLAQRHALSKEQVEEEFRKGGDKEFIAGNVAIEIQGELFLRHKELRQLRQRFWQWFMSVYIEKDFQSAGKLGSQQAKLLLAEAVELGRKERETVVCLRNKKSNPVKGSISLSADLSGDEYLLLDFCPEPKLDDLQKELKEAYAKGMRRFRASSIFGLELLKSFPDCQVSVTYPLPVANSQAVALLSESGVQAATAWIELDDKALEDLLKRVDGGMEVYSYGRPHLLSTRAKIPVEGPFKDGRGAKFFLSVKDGLARVYSDNVLSRKVPKACSNFIDLREAKLKEKNLTAFNDDRDWR